VNEELGAMLMAMGPVGTPLECFTDADEADSFWHERETQRRRRKLVAVEVPWTVERIGRIVYTFAVDHEDFAAVDQGGEPR